LIGAGGLGSQQVSTSPPRRRAHRHRRRRPRRLVEPPAPDRAFDRALGDWKADSAKQTLEALNPDVEVITYKERITSENVDRISPTAGT